MDKPGLRVNTKTNEELAKLGVKVIPEAKPEIKGTTIQGAQTTGVKIVDAANLKREKDEK